MFGKKISLLLFLILFLFVTPIKAIEIDNNYNNPFPDIITNEEITKEIEKFKAKEERNRGFTYIDKLYLIRNNQKLDLRGEYVRKNIQKGDKFEYYVAIIGQSNWAGAFANYEIEAPEIFIPLNDSGKIVTSRQEGVVKKLNLSVKIQPEYNENTILLEKTDSKLKIQFKEVNKIQYIHCVAEVESDNDFAGFFYNPPGMAGSGAQPNNSGATSFFFVPGFFVPVNTHFHYVDDLAYRRINGLSLMDPINERSLNDGNDSNNAHKILQLSNIIESYKTTSLFGRGYFGGVLEQPFFKVENSSESCDLKEPNLKGWGCDDKDKITLTELENNIQNNNLVYMGNDIDTEHDNSNNHKAILGVVDGKISHDKHYYLRYMSKTPYIVNIKKVDKNSKNKGLSGAKFDLYFVNENNEEILIKNNLISDNSGLIHLAKEHSKEDLMSMFENGRVKEGINGIIEISKNIFTTNQEIFLYPGHYRLKEIAAPDGYKVLNENFDFVIEYSQDDIKLLISVENEAKTNIPNIPDSSIDNPPVIHDKNGTPTLPKTGILN